MNNTIGEMNAALIADVDTFRRVMMLAMLILISLDTRCRHHFTLCLRLSPDILLMPPRHFSFC